MKADPRFRTAQTSYHPGGSNCIMTVSFNLDRPVFSITGLPEVVKGALFARYSRYPGTLRRLYLDEFVEQGQSVQAVTQAAGSGLFRSLERH